MASMVMSIYGLDTCSPSTSMRSSPTSGAIMRSAERNWLETVPLIRTVPGFNLEERTLTGG